MFSPIIRPITRSHTQPECGFPQDFTRLMEDLPTDRSLVLVSPSRLEIVPDSFFSHFSGIEAVDESRWNLLQLRFQHGKGLNYHHGAYANPFSDESTGFEKLLQRFPQHVFFFCNSLTKAPVEVQSSWLHRLNNGLIRQDWIWLQQRVSSTHPLRRIRAVHSNHPLSDEQLSLHFFGRTPEDRDISGLAHPTQNLLGKQFTYLPLILQHSGSRFHVVEFVKSLESARPHRESLQTGS